MISCYHNMKVEMALVLMLFLLHQLNNYAAGVQIIESNDSDASMINNAVYKVLQACSKNDVNRVSVLQKSKPSTPFVPYQWNLSNSVVVYDYNAQNVFEDMKTHPYNFQVIIFYELEDSYFNYGLLSKLQRYLPQDRFVKLIFVTFDDKSCKIARRILFHFVEWIKKDYIVHICKPKFFQRVVVWTIKSLQQKRDLYQFRGIGKTKEYMGFSRRYMDEHIDTCDSVFYYHKNLTRQNGRYTLFRLRETHVIVKLNPPLLTFDNNSTVRVWKSESSQIKKIRIESQKEWKVFNGYDGKVMATIFPLLRGDQVVVIMYPEIDEQNSTLIDSEKMDQSARENESIILNSRDWTSILSNTTSISSNTTNFIYPKVQRELRVVKSRGIVGVPVRIREIFNVYIIISAMIISGLFILAQRYLDGRSFRNAALDVYGLILGYVIPKLPNTLASRIFFGSLIFYFIVICTHFQGSVTHIMTVPLVTVNVDSLEDLEASGYTVYAGRSTHKDFGLFRKHFTNFVEYPGDRCIEAVLSDPRAACIDETAYLHSEILKHNNLHLVKEPIKTFFTTYSMDSQSNFKDRFETLHTRLSESGILDKWQRDIEKSSKIREQILEQKEDLNGAPLTLKSWKIFFILLYSGLLISTIVFIGEILHAREN